MTMTTYKCISRVDIDARMAEERRGADNRNELPTRRDDYYQPTTKAKAQAEHMKWHWQV
jgi:hypothetical protein